MMLQSQVCKSRTLILVKNESIILINSSYVRIDCVISNVYRLYNLGDNVEPRETPGNIGFHSGSAPSIFYYFYQLLGLWNPEVQCRIHKGSPIIPILSRINPITRIDTYLFKVHSNIVLLSMPRPPHRSLSCRFTC